jgi:hypothetical protein
MRVVHKHWLALLFALVCMPCFSASSSVFTVPVGLFLASLYHGDWPFNNRLQRPRGVGSSLSRGGDR